MKKSIALLVLCLAVIRVFSLNITIIESQSYNSGHIMDTKWQTVATGMGYTATILPQTTLDNTTFFANTDILIVSSGVIALPSNRVATIQQYIQQGGAVYLQTEYDCTAYTTDVAFASIVNALGGNFTWQGIVAGTLAPMIVSGSLSNTNNIVTSLAYFWYGCSGISGACGNIEPFLTYGGDYFGFIFCPSNLSYGHMITTSDQDWIINSSNINTNEELLMANIITNLANHNYVISGTAYTTNQSFSICNGDSIYVQGGYQTLPGIYHDTLTSVNGCDSIIITTLTINTAIIPTFTPVAAICSGGTLTALPTTSNNGIAGTWCPALNNTATTTYTFTPTAGQCDTTATLTITVNPNNTVPLFTPVPPICSGNTLAALPTTANNGITGTWSPALNNTATTTYTFTPAAGQCATTTTLTITVNPNNTVPTFTPVPPICSGGALSALPTTSNNGITGTWAPALNNTATTTYTFTPATGQCAIATTLTIAINPNNTVPAFNAVSPICSGASLAALPTTSINGIIGAWSPALNNTATTTYTFTPVPGQCAIDTNLTITVNPLPNVSISSNSLAICLRDSVLLTASGATNYTWSNGLGTLDSVTVLPTITTTYVVTGTSGGCTNTGSITITVSTVQITISASSNPICDGASTHITACGATNFIWNNGLGTTGAITVSPTSTSTYIVTGTTSGCTGIDSITINVMPVPIVNLGNNTVLCPHATITLDAGNAGATYLWSNGNNTETITVTDSGTYWVSVNNSNCSASDSIMILNSPKIDLGKDVSLCNQSEITLNAGNASLTYLWSTGETTPTILVSTPGEYWVSSTYANCLLSDTINVTGGFNSLYIPDAFTPDGDLLNDVFKAYGEGITQYDLKIFSRWGELIFETRDMNASWDGTIKGVKAPMGIYVWVVDYNTLCSGDNDLLKYGHVTLVR